MRMSKKLALKLSKEITNSNYKQQIIKDENLKLCKNCFFFTQDKNECFKFGSIDIIFGNLSYDLALKNRTDTDKCGKHAKYFIEK
jgi:hypothetical protein